ncbi:porin, partial [Pseudomonadota bacterium]
FLLPVGILNETHEPNTFYGVERNPVEKDIIPATWWEGGAGIHGEISPGLGFDLYAHSGLETSAANNYAPRKGRQKVGKANAKDLAGTARIKWTAIPGLELAGSVQYQSDIAQDTDNTAGDAMLYTAHAVLQKGPFGLRALYGHWDLDGSGPESVGADEQNGFYIEPSFKISKQLGIFARYNQWDNQAGNSSDSEKEQIDVGINYWPHENIVVKADYMKQDFDNKKGQKGFNLGLGYQF